MIFLCFPMLIPHAASPMLIIGNHAASPMSYWTTNTVYRTTNADAGVEIGMLNGGFKNLIEKAILFSVN